MARTNLTKKCTNNIGSLQPYAQMSDLVSESRIMNSTAGETHTQILQTWRQYPCDKLYLSWTYNCLTYPLPIKPSPPLGLTEQLEIIKKPKLPFKCFLSPSTLELSHQMWKPHRPMTQEQQYSLLHLIQDGIPHNLSTFWCGTVLPYNSGRPWNSRP